ncbi:hypothetical protein CYMTET_28831 [Cymbomonas tetramitiformis]|uniref:Uncharacterized protein n=1 Tax=Cymbomonas tetramitiformis TaxID=36881 RepID=A0AAE0KVI4_9CHLO|nr:hypothetical protein CYMTET_28831 [Cymbomonas tetramitiformis]
MLASFARWMRNVAAMCAKTTPWPTCIIWHGAANSQPLEVLGTAWPARSKLNVQNMPASEAGGESFVEEIEGLPMSKLSVESSASSSDV